MVRFSVDSIDYFVEKSCQCRDLSDESLNYLTEQISQIILALLEDASKILRKCRRTTMTTDDFRFALKLRHSIPTYGNYTSSSMDQCIFRKTRKDNRVLHQIDDEIVQLDEFITQQPKLPIDLSIRTHWLAINGKQPLINENPSFESSLKSNSASNLRKKSKKSHSRSHILHLEQQIYFKQMTELCLCNDDEKRKQALSIVCADHSLQQIIGQLILFISEGIRVNIVMNYDRSMVLNNLLEMSDALLQNNTLNIESYLHVFHPSILSCLLEQRYTVDHWTRRDLAAKCSTQIIRRYSTAANRLQQRTIEIFYRILIASDEQYPWSTIYGALIGLCQMGHKVMIQIVFPLIKRLGEQIQSLINEEENDRTEISRRLTECVIKYVLMTFRSIANDYEMNEKELIDDFGSYFAPLIQHELILLL